MLRVDCKECGKAFSTSSRSARYCSDGCRAEAGRRYSREYMRKYMSDPDKRAMMLARTRAAAANRRAKEGKEGRRQRRLREKERQRRLAAAGGGTERPPRAEASKPTSCGLCGRSFEPYGRAHHAYCKRCTAKADKEIARVLRINCKECGKAFSTSNRAVRYCSAECRAEGRRTQDRRHMHESAADPEKHAIRLARTRAWAASRRALKREQGRRTARSA